MVLPDSLQIASFIHFGKTFLAISKGSIVEIRNLVTHKIKIIDTQLIIKELIVLPRMKEKTNLIVSLHLVKTDELIKVWNLNNITRPEFVLELLGLRTFPQIKSFFYKEGYLLLVCESTCFKIYSKNFHSVPLFTINNLSEYTKVITGSRLSNHELIITKYESTIYVYGLTNYITKIENQIDKEFYKIYNICTYYHNKKSEYLICGLDWY